VALPLRGTSDDGWFTATLTVTVTFTAIVTVIVVVTVINTVTVIVTVAITAALPLRGISGGGCFTVTFIVTVVVTFFVAVTAVPEHVRFPCECGRKHVASSLCGGSGRVCTHMHKCLCVRECVFVCACVCFIKHVRFPCECGREHVASSLCGGSGNVCTHTQKCLCVCVCVRVCVFQSMSASRASVAVSMWRAACVEEVEMYAHIRRSVYVCMCVYILEHIRLLCECGREQVASCL